MDTSCCCYRPWTSDPLKPGEFEGETTSGVRYVAAIFPSPEEVPEGWVDSPARLVGSPASTPTLANGEGEGAAETAPPADLGRAPSPPDPPREMSAKDELEALRKEAAELGIAVDSKWGVRRLRAAIQRVRSGDDSA